MDPRERADAQLARAVAARQNVVTPDNAISPMDGATSRIPRSVITAAEPFDDPVTQSIPAPGTVAAPRAWDEDPATEPVGHTRLRPSPVPRVPVVEADLVDEDEDTRALDGLVPTVQTQGKKRSVSDRLSGLD